MAAQNWVSAAQGIEGVWGYTWPTDMGDGKHILTVMVTDRAGNTATQTLEFFIDTRLSTPTIALDSTDDTGTPGDDMTNRTPTDLYSAEYRFGCYQRYSQRHA
ncbi:Ig domain-containing protein [Salmonella enterica subsp. enterica]|uniref:Ig domain-containing protein n=1 Tax=Salmonella enterica I TaxID=59201 RepID=A0A447PWU8_SALET|nr:Ig domain-containing protein [Salmonella enterica subsp. enterica]